MPMVGMDVAEVRALATQLHTASSDITNIVHQLTSKLASTTWVGQDRMNFESDWQSRHVSNLNAVATALQDASQTATRNATEQETASGS